MKVISKNVEKTTTEKKNFIWNMFGSTLLSASSMLLSLIIIRSLGVEEGGVFAIAITVAQMLAFIEYYETRTFQVTDVKNSFTFGQYKATKIILLMVSVIVGTIYSFVKGQGDLHRFLVLFLMCIYKYIDAYADLYEGTFQKDGRLDLTGKSQAYRTILSVGALLLTISVTKDLVCGIVIAILVAIVGVVLFDVLPMKSFREIKAEWNTKAVKGIIKDCFPLFLGSFLWSYILSASRIAVDTHMHSNYSSYFQTIFMPVSIINLCATFILKPALTSLSYEYKNLSLNRKFIKTIVNISIMITIFTVFCMVGAYLVGIPLLEIITASDLDEYRGVMTFLMFAGGINSLSYFGYYILTIMRKTGWIFTGYIIATIVARMTNNYCVREYGINGAAFGFFLSVSVLMIVFILGIINDIFQNKAKEM